MRTQRRISFLICVLFAAVIACITPNVTITDPVVQASLQALTVDAAVRATQQAVRVGTVPPPPSVFPTVSQSVAPTLTLVPSETPVPTATVTLLIIMSPTTMVPMISVSIPTNCRSGPGKDYEVDGGLLVGETAQVYARDPSGHYWYIPNPDSPGDFCWVWDEYATFSGLTSSLPVFTPPPTPTATFTPTPTPGFDASYEGVVWCTGTWWTEIALDNTGSLNFRSYEFTLRDVDLDISVSDAADGFVDRPDCSSSSSKVSLQPGKTVMLSSPAVDNDPAGHKMRATIKLCSDKGQEGECVTKTIRFTP